MSGSRDYSKDASTRSPNAALFKSSCTQQQYQHTQQRSRTRLKLPYQTSVCSCLLNGGQVQCSRSLTRPSFHDDHSVRYTWLNIGQCRMISYFQERKTKPTPPPSQQQLHRRPLCTSISGSWAQDSTSSSSSRMPFTETKRSISCGSMIVGACDTRTCCARQRQEKDCTDRTRRNRNHIRSAVHCRFPAEHHGWLS